MAGTTSTYTTTQTITNFKFSVINSTSEFNSASDRNENIIIVHNSSPKKAYSNDANTDLTAIENGVYGSLKTM